jgi:hypothetical protein
MKPAYHIPLSDDDLKALGEMCATQGQIEYLMVLITARLLQIAPTTAAEILGSTNFRTKALLWHKIFMSKCGDERLRAKATQLSEELPKSVAQRNTFVHAFYAESINEQFITFQRDDSRTGRPAVAVNVRKGPDRQNPATGIREARDNMARDCAALARLWDDLNQGSGARTP